VKILHTSDLQLDAPFTFLGEKGQHHRQQLLETFNAIVDIAGGEGYDMLLIAGDLFDSNRPLQSTLDHVSSTLARLAIPVCIIPGNHDCYNEKSIYRRADFPPNVTIFTDEITRVEFSDLNCTVYGNAITQKDSKESPLKNIQAKEGQGWQVALAHGNLVVGATKNPPRPITLEEIADSGMDYIALGDWHGFADYSQGTVRATYSGSPEPMAFNQEQAGYVADVTLEDGRVEVEKRRVGRFHTRREEINVTGRDQAALEALLMEHEDPDLMLEVDLIGLHEIGTLIDPVDLEKVLSDRVYALRIQDQAHMQLQDLSIDEFPEEHIIGKFVNIMSQRISAAQNEAEISNLQRALQIGVALLQGKEVI
jgi:DNA repair exonuclease SbcCD nuclease subunit